MSFEFKEPDLAGFGDDATDQEVLLAKKYTRIREIVDGDEPDAHTAWLVVDNQQFCVSILAHKNAEEASWKCWMLAKALNKIVD